MVGKQVIIDGIDVSECNELVNKCDCYLTQEHDYRSETPYTYNKCSGFPNCYYKQLKHKEQECERLEGANNTLTVTREKLLGDLCIVEESLKDYTEHYNRQSEELDQLKVERDKIKAIGNNYFDEYEMCCLDLPDAIDSLLKRYDSAFAIFKKERKEFKEECDKLKQTLTEIKPILELYANSKIGEEQLGGTYKITVRDLSVLGGSYLAYYDPRPAKQALQKISECEVEND